MAHLTQAVCEVNSLRDADAFGLFANGKTTNEDGRLKAERPRVRGDVVLYLSDFLERTVAQPDEASKRDAAGRIKALGRLNDT